MGLKKISIKNYKVLLSALVVFLLSASYVAAGFGVSPPFIIEDRLVPGSSFERSIMLVQGTPERPLPVTVSVESNNIKDWVSFPNGSEFVIPKGVQQHPMLVKIEVPEDAELGLYKAFIRISTTPEAVTGGGEVAIAIGGLVEVELTIGDDVIVDYEIVSVNISNIKEGENPKATVKLRNKGNSPVAPDSASFELFDKFGTNRLAYITTERDAFETVPAFTEKDLLVEFPTDFRVGIGQYRGHVKVYNDKGEVLGQSKTTFDVLEKTFWEKYGLIITIVLAIIVVLLLVLIILRWRNKRKLKKLRQNNEA